MFKTVLVNNKEVCLTLSEISFIIEKEKFPATVFKLLPGNNFFIYRDKDLVFRVYDECGRYACVDVSDDCRSVLVYSQEKKSKIDFNTKGYEDLTRILNMAFKHASEGKGVERHANGRPFDRQPIMEIGRMCGLGYHTGQAMKKIQEAHKLLEIRGKEAAINELIGAINYLAAAVKLIEEKMDKEHYIG